MSLENQLTADTPIEEVQSLELLYDAVFEQSHDFAVVIEPHGYVLEANERAFELSGTERSEIVMKRLWKTPWFHHADTDSHELKEMLQRAVGGQRIDQELAIDSPEGKIVIDTTIQPVTDRADVVEALFLSGREITDLKREISTLNAQNECLDEFVRAVTHDVRNLLTVASGNIELATEGESSPELDSANRSLEQAQNLIDDLSQAISDGQLISERSTLTLALLAREAWHHVKTTHASLSIESSMQLEADKTRLTELLENLYRNAVEHAGPDVTVRVGSFDGGFYVADDGPGLPDLNGEDPFEAGVTTTAEGTGLGLAIVQNIADAHGWEMRVNESEDGGARFEVLIK